MMYCEWISDELGEGTACLGGESEYRVESKKDDACVVLANQPGRRRSESRFKSVSRGVLYNFRIYLPFFL